MFYWVSEFDNLSLRHYAECIHAECRYPKRRGAIIYTNFNPNLKIVSTNKHSSLLWRHSSHDEKVL